MMMIVCMLQRTKIHFDLQFQLGLPWSDVLVSATSSGRGLMVPMHWLGF